MGNTFDHSTCVFVPHFHSQTLILLRYFVSGKMSLSIFNIKKIFLMALNVDCAEIHAFMIIWILQPKQLNDSIAR